jgi:hypothetical protein
MYVAEATTVDSVWVFFRGISIVIITQQLGHGEGSQCDFE